MSGCKRGCLLLGQHKPHCTCTAECPDHDKHCGGCLPRAAEIGTGPQDDITGYCQRCAFQLRDTIEALSPLITGCALLPGGALAPPEATNGDHTRRGTKVDQISPSPAHDTADEAARWLNNWAIAVADERTERGPFEYRRDGIPEPNPHAEAHYLTSRLAHLCAAEYGNDLNDEARELQNRLTKATGTDEADQRIPTRCPACDQRTLIRPNGEEYVTCRNRRCTAVWYSDGYQMLAKVINS